MNTTVKPTTIAFSVLVLFSVNTFSDTRRGQAQEQIKRSDDAIKQEDYETAFRLAYPLAKQGNAQAQQNVGYVYDVKGNLQEAIKWYQMAVSTPRQVNLP